MTNDGVQQHDLGQISAGNVGQAESIGPELWEIRRPFRLVGVNLGSRMTVARLPDGSLVLHSPVQLRAPVQRTLDGMGRVRHIIAPNTMHHMFIAPYLSNYPDAIAYAAPGLAQKRADLPFNETLSDEPSPELAEAFDQHVFRGTHRFHEVVFFHRPSKSLIVTDLVFNLQGPRTLWEKIFLVMNRAGGRPGPSRLLRSMISDRKAARRSIDKMLAWEPERLVMSHGEIIRTGAKQALENAFMWL